MHDNIDLFHYFEYRVGLRLEQNASVASRVAESGNLAILRWLDSLSTHRCEYWSDVHFSAAAAQGGNLEMVQWMHVEKKCP